MEKKAISKLQEILQQQFTKFIAVEVNGVDILIMPMKDDIPIIEKAHVDKENDCLVLTFKTSIPVNLSFEDDEIVHFIRTENNAIKGIEIKNFTQLIANKLKGHHYHIIDKNRDFKSPQEVDRYSFTKRTADFIKDLTHADFKELHLAR